MGSGRRSLGIEPMGSNEKTGSRPEVCQGVDSCPFFYDSRPDGWIPTGTYIRDSELILGDVDIPSDVHSENNQNSCFNCGSVHHLLGSCPSPRDHLRISLSRQYYNFFKDDSSGRPERLVNVFEWQRQRLEWAEEFEPGTIKNPLLRHALGEDEAYLKNICHWGYPKGWFSIRDPREVMKERILNSGSHEARDENPFFIFGDKVESLSSSTTTSDEKNISAPLTPAGEPRRWAKYPPAYFHTDMLPMYIPTITNLVEAQDDCNSTFTPDRQVLWEMIISGRMLLESDPTPSSIPPWRLPDAFSEHSSLSSSRKGNCDLPPPCPARSPSPLPPAPPQSIAELSDEPFLAPQPQPRLQSVSPYGLLFWEPPDVCASYSGTSPRGVETVTLSHGIPDASGEQDMEFSDEE